MRKVLITGWKILASSVACCVVLGLAGCGGGSGGGVSSDPTIRITAQPNNQSVNAGQSVTFAVTASSDAALAYQWLRNGEAVAHATGPTISFAAQLGDGGSQWSVRVSNGANSVISQTAALAVSTVGPGLSLVHGDWDPGGQGHRDGVGTQARFSTLRVLVADPAGGFVAIDGYLRKISATGLVTTLGEGGYGTAVDKAGNAYLTYLNAIRKVTPGGVVSTIAGAPNERGFVDSPDSLSARFERPTGIAVDPAGNIFVGDCANAAVRKIDAAGAVTTVISKMPCPEHLVADNVGNIYVGSGQGSGHVRSVDEGVDLRKITLSGAVSSLPLKVTNLSTDLAGNVYVTGAPDGVLRRISPSGEIAALPNFPVKEGPFAFDPAGNIYVPGGLIAPTIKKYSPDGSHVTWAGKVAPNRSLTAFAQDSTGNLVFNAASHDPAKLRELYQIKPTGSISSLGTHSNSIRAMLFDQQGSFYTVRDEGSSCGYIVCSSSWDVLSKLTPDGKETTIKGTVFSYFSSYPASPETFGYINAMASDSGGNLWIRDGIFLRKSSPQGAVSTVLKFAEARQGTSSGMVIDAQGNMYLSTNFGGENESSATVQIVTPSGQIMTLAGSESEPGWADGPRETARFGYLRSIALDGLGNVLVIDTGDGATVRRISSDGTVTTVAGQRGLNGNRLGALPGGLASVRSMVSAGSSTFYLLSDFAILKLQLLPPTEN